MENDTQAPPEDSGQVAEPIAETAPEPETTPEPTPEPVQLTPEEIEERAFQRTASWMGRREKEFSDNILRNVTQVLDQRLSQIRPEPAPTPTDVASVFDNPDAWLEKSVPKIFEKEITRRSNAEKSFTAEIIRHAGQQMDSDPLFENKEFGNEVIGEIQRNFGSIDKRMPADLAARMLVTDAVTNIYRKKIGTKQNPFSGNKPGNVQGTIKAPVKSVAKEPPIKLDNMAKKVAEWFGNTEEDVRKMLGK